MSASSLTARQPHATSALLPLAAVHTTETLDKQHQPGAPSSRGTVGKAGWGIINCSRVAYRHAMHRQRCGLCDGWTMQLPSWPATSHPPIWHPVHADRMPTGARCLRHQRYAGGAARAHSTCCEQMQQLR